MDRRELLSEWEPLKRFGRLRAMRRLLLLVLLALPLSASAENARYFSYFDGWPRDTHPLDATPRFLEEGERLGRCSAEGLVRHRGENIRYVARVHPAFAARLTKFESLLSELARAHYGRAPRRLVHQGTFNCRRARGRRGRISEHAFGNALDLQGFDFGPLPRSAQSPSELPRRLRRAFQVRVARHWSPRAERDQAHARFLHELAETLRARPDIFRGIVGPPRPRHGNHLHLDASPWRYSMFAYGEESP